MDKQQAQNIIKETFESPFDRERFRRFIKDLLNRIEEASFTYQGKYIPDAYKQYISKLERIGKFSDGENSIDIMIITLQKETSLEHARTMQRNFIAWYLNGSRGGEMKDAALAAFVSPDKEDWRFSLVKMDYKFEKTTSGKMKVKEEFTPSRRWSFLVGANEKSHTAQSRLAPVLANDEHDPTLKEIEKAFDIETVTKEFFLKYRDLFLHTKEELDRIVKKDQKVKADFEAKGVDTVNFAKKLLGQIVFLYFLQKKGWFGVGRDDDWGTGSKHFLRELFEKKHADYSNFYNDILEPLFYEALRTGEDRKHEDYYYSRFDCKIPFLNGGLFDPIGNYDWVHTDIIIPDKLFSNNFKTKEGDTGTGILDVFDRYNFTVKEDEPLEKEVAIDPELLGKAYEKFNAIRPDNYDEFKKALKSGKTGEENKFNKKFGVYYTPREIVHYMCQQSLINYLVTQASSLDDHRQDACDTVSKEDIETLIQLGEQVSENEATALIKEQRIAEGKQKTTKNKPILSESIRENAERIDKKLAEITVCDPAVGSGAFPVGMISEIVRARNVLSTFINRQDACATVYNFKRRCIEHSLYGVDIDPGAVEIAKLRLWLSLVVDEDDIKNIKPLPNLDYRIMQGNSLISEFMGVNFDDDKAKEDGDLFKDEADELIKQFQQKKDEFLRESNVSRKSKLKEEIDDLLIKIFETKLKTQKADYFNRLKDIENKYSILPNEKQRNELIKKEKGKLYKEYGFDLESAEKQLKEFTSGRKIKPFFLWNLYFSEVFHHKGGFDVVIANPPYLRIQGIQEHSPEMAKIYQKAYVSSTGKFDLYVLFVEKGLDLANSTNGIVNFIMPDKWIHSAFGKGLRKFISKNQYLKRIISFGAFQVFNASTYSSLTWFQKKGEGIADFISLNRDLRTNVELSNFLDSLNQSSFSHINNTKLNSENWFFSSKKVSEILNKIKKQPLQLKDIVDGIYQGIVSNGDDIFVLAGHLKNSSFFGYSKRIKRTVELEKSILKPILKGEDIRRYSKLNPKNYVIYPHIIDEFGKTWPMEENHLKINFPLAYEYLAQFKKELINKKIRYKTNKKYWFSLHRSREISMFEKSKIITPYLSIGGDMTIDTEGLYSNAKCYNIILKSSYDGFIKLYIAILNSSLFWFYMKNVAAVFRGDYYAYTSDYLSPFPIPKELSPDEQQPFIFLVDQILAITKDEDYMQTPQNQAKVKALEAEIDHLVCKLYDLTPEEIKIVEGEKPK